MVECIFCKIAGHEINARFVHETDELAAFQDLNPQAPTHILIVSKKHVAGLSACDDDDKALLGHLQRVAAAVAKKAGISAGYRLLTNNGRAAGQSVDHLHYHLLGGRSMQWPPG